MKTKFSSSIDAARWIAALFVVIGHSRHIILADYKDVADKQLWIKALYFLTGLGHEAVIVFFVISGLLVGGGVINKWQNFNYGDYFLNRFCRIYTVLIPALLLGASVDWLGGTYFDQLQLYSNPAQYHTISHNIPVPSQLNLPTFVGNLFMLQEITVSTFGSNNPLWSLSNEWWYYCLFPLLTAAIVGKNLRTMLLALLATALFFIASPEKLAYMAIWLMGVGVFIYGKYELPKLPAYLGWAIFIIALMASRLSHSTDNLINREPEWVSFARDFGFAIAFSILLISLQHNKKPATFLVNFHRTMADFSYTIYLTHFPLLILAVAIAGGIFNIPFLGQPNGAGILYLGCMLVGLYIFGYIFSLISERHTDVVRSTIKSAIMKIAKHP